MRRSASFLALLMLPALALQAQASNFSVAGPGGAIPDAPSGPPPGTWNSSYTGTPFVSSVALANPVLSLLDVRLLGLHHTWRGDLRFYLTDPQGNAFNLIVRPGSNGSTVGDSGDYLIGDYTLVPSSGGNLQQGASDLQPGVYDQYFNFGSGQWTQGASNSPLTSISGAAGNWSLVIEDWANQDTGALTGWVLEGLDSGGGSTFTAFCGAGDPQLTTPCPCGVDGATGHGCENSALSGGALLGATGSPALDDVVLASSGELPTSLSIFLQGQQSVPAGIVFGTGVRCAAGSLRRLYARNASAGSVSAPGPGDPSIRTQSAALGDPIAPGTSRSYQVYYRDPAGGPALCGGATFNVSSAISIVWP
jgi:hypothetical protein